ncbi:hypothetical protein NC652_022170 [Populus alba x Populus x berolinensis]|nr:hypothetical protein NC652_022170 [Populus alba x Populus x berolinensis]
MDRKNYIRIKVWLHEVKQDYCIAEACDSCRKLLLIVAGDMAHTVDPLYPVYLMGSLMTSNVKLPTTSGRNTITGVDSRRFNSFTEFREAYCTSTQCAHGFA